MFTGGTVDRGGGEVDHLLAVGAQDRVMGLVGVGRGGVEDDADLGIGRHPLQAFDPLMGGGHAALAGHRQALGLRVDADHRGELHVLGVLQHLHHQVGADVARADDRGLHFRQSRRS